MFPQLIPEREVTDYPYLGRSKRHEMKVFPLVPTELTDTFGMFWKHNPKSPTVS